MPFYRRVGEIPHKKHTTFRRPDGGLFAEEMMGAEGFSSDSSLLYHLHSPVSLVDVRTWETPSAALEPNAPARPRHVKPTSPDALALYGADAVNGRRIIAGNADVEISWAMPTEPSPLYRNAMGDEVVFVVSGRARIETVFGALEAGPGDYVHLPTTTVHRWIPLDHDDPLRLLITAASAHITTPSKYLSERGQFLEGAPYCERDLHGPESPLLAEGTDVEVYVRHREGSAVLVYAHHPFDVVGWDGCLYPYIFNIRDFEPVIGSILQPPPAYQTFAGPNFVMCSFVPHKLEFHPEAIPVPYNHANVDSDELMFYWDGNFGSRGKTSGVERFSMSIHPTGWSHGPHPGAVDGALEAMRNGVDFIEETAVMIDTFRPLQFGEAGQAGDQPDYFRTWLRPAATAGA